MSNKGIQDYFKRTREEELSPGSEQRNTKKSKKPKPVQTTSAMDSSSNNSREQKNLTLEGMFNFLRGAMDEIRRENAEVRSELAALRDHLERREKEWQEERKVLLSRITSLERKLEEKDREGRKRNIIIHGLDVGTEDLIESVSKFLHEKVGVKACIRSAASLGKMEQKMLLVRLENLQDKKTIMSNRRRLKRESSREERAIYINNDLTINEREIQKELRKFSKEKREQGYRVKVGYKKISINDTWYNWNEVKLGTFN